MDWMVISDGYITQSLDIGPGYIWSSDRTSDVGVPLLSGLYFKLFRLNFSFSLPNEYYRDFSWSYLTLFASRQYFKNN